MVDLSPVVKWYSNGGLKFRLTKPVYGPKCPLFEWYGPPRHVRDFTI